MINIMFEKIVPFIKDRLTKHHELYTLRCKDVYWEENCANALRDSGFGSDWKPDFSHIPGVDQTTNCGIRISNKSGIVTLDKKGLDVLSIKFSSHRLQKYKTLTEKIDYLSVKLDDYIFCLGSNSKLFKNKIYYLILIESKSLDYKNQTWQEQYNDSNALTKWYCNSPDLNCEIKRSVSDQLWVDVSRNLFAEIYEIVI